MSKIIRIDTLHNGDRHSCAANGDGIRIVVWWNYCDIHCPGCHNRQYWDYDNNDFDDFCEEHIKLVVDETHKYENIYKGVSILGGEPFSTKNIDDVIVFCERYREQCPDKDIWIWSGHTYEWLKSRTGKYGDDVKKLLSLCDFLVDGPFILERRNISLKFRGSDNQRIIDLKNEKVIC